MCDPDHHRRRRRHDGHSGSNDGGNPQVQQIGPGRISFSSDFVVEPSRPSHSLGPGDLDFEFAVGSRPMMAADQLFFKGRILPLARVPATTLREELRSNDHEDHEEHEDHAPVAVSTAGAHKPTASIRWKDIFGRKKATTLIPHINSRKSKAEKRSNVAGRTTDDSSDDCLGQGQGQER